MPPRAPSGSGAASGTATETPMPSGRYARTTTGPSGGATEASSPAVTYPPATTPGVAGPGAGPGGTWSTTTLADIPCRLWSCPSGPSAGSDLFRGFLASSASARRRPPQRYTLSSPLTAFTADEGALNYHLKLNSPYDSISSGLFPLRTARLRKILALNPEP